MTAHKTFREMDKHASMQRAKVHADIQTLLKTYKHEEVLMMLSELASLLWAAQQEVEEKLIINQTTKEDVEELI